MKPAKCVDSVKEDRSQVFLYRTPGFNVYIRQNIFPQMMPFCVTDHWHDEVEFVYITKGSIQYTIEGEVKILKAGQGLFINSRKLHVANSDKDTPCEFYCAIMHPMLLCASKYVDDTFVEPIIKNPSLKYLFLDSHDDWAKEALDIIEKMNEYTQMEGHEMQVQMLFFAIWQIIFDHSVNSDTKPLKANHHLSTLKDMIAYIQQHYAEKVTLEEISNAGCVGKTMCTKLFTTYVNRTPIEFLKDYRIQQSIVLLKTTDLSITDICYETGFSGASYFGECFREVTGCSPLEYRKQHVDRPLSHYSRKRRMD